ncbi:ParB N-terminal domain-containing protein [Rhodobacterales bacterium HKCCE4037]|nr:ParB N-terminal domain-containing protein [Rhodobacterales bacterium HKCCE4037]
MTDTLHPIDLTGYRPAELRDQVQPMLIWAKVADLVIDRSYQRAITSAGKRAIQKIADEFDWTKFEPILVAPSAGGRLAVVDGQHRAHGAALAGIEEVPAMSVPMTPQQQASGFAAVNRDRIRMSLHQIYRAELAGGSAWARECHDAVEAAGCKLASSNTSTGQKKPRIIYAIGLIKRMVANGEGLAVTAGLAGIAASGQGCAVSAYDGRILNIWLPALARNQRLLTIDLAAAFDVIDIEGIHEAALQRTRLGGPPARRATQDRVFDDLMAFAKEAADAAA